MKIINKVIRKYFWWSLMLSIGMPVGVLGIIFGAIYKLWFMLAIGAGLVLAGFYVMPLLWVTYGEKRACRSMLYLIENEHLLTVEDLCNQTMYDANKVRKMVNYLIMSHALVGYVFKDDVLTKNNRKKKEYNKCTNCGAMMDVIDGEFVCGFCGHRSKVVKE